MEGATSPPTDGRRTGARHPSPQGGRKTASGAWRVRRKRRSRQRWIEPLDFTSSSDGVGEKPEHDREVVAGDERQEGSRPQRCGTAADEEETFAGWRASGDDGYSPRSFGFDDRSARNLANPRPGTGCDMPEAVNGGNRRGGEKPRGRSETGGVATVGRRRVSILREWTFTGPSGDGPSQGRSSRRGRSRTPRGERVPLGSARTPKARPRWGGGVTGFERSRQAPRHRRP